MSSHSYPVTGGGSSTYYGDPVADVGSLPPSGAAVGEQRLVLDVDDIYEWNGSSWQRITQDSADVGGPSSSVDSEIALFSGTGGKTIKRASGTGFVKVTSGVMGTPSATVSLTAEVSGVLPVANGGTNSSTALNNNRVMQSSAGAVVEAAAITASRALASDANGIPTHSATTDTELGYLSGVTSSVQTQLDAKLAKSGGTMTGDIVLAGDPDSALKPATKQYVDALLAGVSRKAPVKAASTANLTLSGEQTVDGISLTTGDRVLAKDQNTTSENGIYIVDASTWSRSSDANSAAELNGALVAVAQGSTQGNTGWYQDAEVTTIDSDAVSFTQQFGPGTYAAGTGVTLTGNTFSQTPLTASRAVVSDGSGNYSAATTTATEIGYVNGVTSAIQTQLDAKLCCTTTVNISSDTTLTNKAVHFVDTSAARALTLPAPSTSLYMVIKDTTGSAASNNITLVRPGSQNIETVAASYVLDTNLGSWTIVSNGTDYFIT